MTSFWAEIGITQGQIAIDRQRYLMVMISWVLTMTQPIVDMGLGTKVLYYVSHIYSLDPWK